MYFHEVKITFLYSITPHSQNAAQHQVSLPAILVFLNVFEVSTAMVFTWSLHSSLLLTRFLFRFTIC